MTPRTANDVLALQHSAGNRAVVQMVGRRKGSQRQVAQRPVAQRQGGLVYGPPAPNQTPADEGGPADITNLEQDMRDILQQWQDGAKDGISQFVTNQLNARLEDLESGSWGTFFGSLLGNTIWAACCFNPVGEAALAAWKIFAISMAGIGVAAAPTVPGKSKSKIPEIQSACVDYINDVYKQLNGQLREKAGALIKQSPGVSRYRALADFVRASFKRGTYFVDGTNRTVPMLDKSAVRTMFLAIANERLDLAKNLGESKTDYGMSDPETGVTIIEPSSTVTELAWVKGQQGPPRLAVLEAHFEGIDMAKYPIPEEASHTFKRWVSDSSKDAAVAQWVARRRTSPRVYPAEKVDSLRG
jgi:hypothetical protein